MINATLTVKIQSFNETHDAQGVKIVYGDCSFQSYSKDGLAESTIPFRAKGAAAVALTKHGTGNGVVVGYPDLVVVENADGYKEKKVTLVIRNFISTIQSQPEFTEKYLQFQPTQPVAERVLVAAAQKSNEVSVNEYSDTEDIPF